MIRPLLFASLTCIFFSACFPSASLRGGYGVNTKDRVPMPQVSLDLGTAGDIRTDKIDLLNLYVTSAYYAGSNNNDILAFGFKAGITKWGSQSSTLVYAGVEGGPMLIPELKNEVYTGLKAGVDFRPWGTAKKDNFKNFLGIGLELQGGIISRSNNSPMSRLGVSVIAIFAFP